MPDQSFPTRSTTTSQGNSDKVTGPSGKVFNRILGRDEGAEDSRGMAFQRDQLRAYLDQKLGMAEGEFFRGTKLDGVTDALFGHLDSNKDGQVDWVEFGAFKAQTLASVAPGSKPGDSPEKVQAAANQRFDQLDKKGPKGSLGYGEIESGTKSALPEGTDHADLVAQLGARIALDAVDTDQRKSPVKDRSLSREEWAQAAAALAR